MLPKSIENRAWNRSGATCVHFDVPGGSGRGVTPLNLTKICRKTTHKLQPSGAAVTSLENAYKCVLATGSPQDGCKTNFVLAATVTSLETAYKKRPCHRQSPRRAPFATFSTATVTSLEHAYKKRPRRRQSPRRAQILILCDSVIIDCLQQASSPQAIPRKGSNLKFSTATETSLEHACKSPRGAQISNF